MKIGESALQQRDFHFAPLFVQELLRASQIRKLAFDRLAIIGRWSGWLLLSDRGRPVEAGRLYLPLRNEDIKGA